MDSVEITLRYAQIKRLLGCEIEAGKCLSILENLGFEILGRRKKYYNRVNDAIIMTKKLV